MLGLGNGLGFNRVIGVPFLLNKFTGAAAAYSLRALSSTTTDVVRVRRSSDNAEQDFNPDEIIDGTLETWVGATDSGFVTTWYDQSGNGNDATQTTAANQPKIVDAGVLVEENGKPAVDFDGVDDTLSLVGYSIVTTLNEVASFVVFKQNSTGQTSAVLNLGASSDDTRFYLPRLITQIRLGYGNSQSLIASGIDDTNQHLLSVYTDSTNVNFTVDDVFTGASPIQNVTITNLTNQNIGLLNNSLDGKVQELIIYSSDQSANRTAIEASINNHYLIY